MIHARGRFTSWPTGSGRRPKGNVPRVAHRLANGSWELKTAHLTRSGALVVNLPSWLDPSHIWSNLKQWASDAGNWVASGVGGRTPPLTNCGPAAPGWFAYDKESDLVHTCSIDNNGRGEIQIKSNRGITIEVHIPGNPAYVWVENQSDWMRRAYSLGGDPNQSVLLGPGQRMTVGYTRPATDFTGEFTNRRRQLASIRRRRNPQPA